MYFSNMESPLYGFRPSHFQARGPGARAQYNRVIMHDRRSLDCLSL